MWRALARLARQVLAAGRSSCLEHERPAKYRGAMTTKPRIILDCDPGLDDAIAIAMAIRLGDVVGITTVGGNVDLAHTTENALAVCDILGRPDIAVHAGHDLPLNGSTGHRANDFHGPRGTGHIEFAPASRPASSDDAAAWIIETVRAEPGIHLIATGPLTNIAHALRQAPEIVDLTAGITWMGGSTGNGNTTPGAEFNALVDPEAVEIVFTAGHPNVTMAGLNATHQVLLDRTWIGDLRVRMADDSMTVFCDLLEYYDERQHEFTTLAGAAVHDALAVVAVTHPDLVAGVRCPVQVVTADGPARGMTLVDQRPVRHPDPGNVRVLEWVNVAKTKELLRDTLSS